MCDLPTAPGGALLLPAPFLSHLPLALLWLPEPEAGLT